MAELLRDSFTDSNGVLLKDHTGELNTNWFSNPDDGDFQTGLADEVEIFNNRLRRATLYGGKFRIYSNSAPTMDGIVNFTIEFDVRMEDTTGSGPAEIIVCDNTALATQDNEFLYIDLGAGTRKYLLHTPSTYESSALIPCSDGVAFNVRIEVTGQHVEVFDDDVLVVQADMDDDFIGALGFSVADSSGTQNTSVGLFLWSDDSVGEPFWTQRVRAQEVI